MSKEIDVEDSGLTPEDYEKYFLFSPKIIASMFLVILIVVGGILYWFDKSMLYNSNRRVHEAVVIMDKVKSDTAEITPLTLELEEMVVETEENRSYLANQLTSDSFIKQLDSKLKKQFLNQTTYFKLPENWKAKLPPKLNKFYQEERSRRVARIRQFLSRMPKIIESNRQRIKQLDTIIETLNIDDSFSDALQRYRYGRDNFLRELKEVEEELQKHNVESLTAVKLPPKLYSEMTDLIDPFTIMILQYRRFSAFSSVPTGYFYAEQILRDALRIDPKNPEAWYQLGVVYERMGLSTISSEHYVRAIKVEPGHHRTSEIVEKFKSKVSADTGSSRAHYDYAWALYEIGQKEKAKKHLQRVLKIEGSNKSMVKRLAKLRLDYIREGEPPYHRISYF